MPGAWQLSPREVVSVAAFVHSLAALAPETLPGDPARGARLYTEQGCAACHIVAGQGEGNRARVDHDRHPRSGAHLRESLVNPGGFVPEEFASAKPSQRRAKLSAESGRTRTRSPSRSRTPRGGSAAFEKLSSGRLG